MAAWHDVELACARCATSFVAKVATHLPAARVACQSCGDTIEVAQPVIHTDFERGHWIEVRPPSELARWRDLAIACRATFARAFERGAPILRDRAPAFRVRLVFGEDELRDKIAVWNAGLDDIVVEHAKLLAIRDQPSIFGVRDRLLVRAVDGDRLIVDRHRDGKVDATFTVSAASAAGVHAIDFDDPFVSLNRAIGAFALRSET